MIVKILFGQRIESYSGQYAPEALAVATEYDDDENPEYLEKEKKRMLGSKEFSSIAVVNIEIADNELNSILSPEAKEIKGKIIK